ncbi:MAG: IS66 family transposase [Polyangiales bacterium]
MTTPPAQTPTHAERIAALERQLAAAATERAALAEKLRDAELSLQRVRAAYTKALEQLALQRRRVFVASSERRDDEGAQLAFEAMVEQVRKLSEQLDAAAAAAGEDSGDDDDKGAARKRDRSPRGRRDLAETDLPVERIEILDDTLEGVATRITFEESSRLGYRKGGPVRIVLARAVYKSDAEAATPATAPATAESPSATLTTAAMPRELFKRGFLAPSMVAHLLTSKYLLGVPFYRLEQTFVLRGFALDRGTMSRYAEDAGATLGAIVEAARTDAFARAFCLSTDATGVRVQPGSLTERGHRRGPCHKGHFFVTLADRDHVFFDYQERHTSAAVSSMFRGFSGYIQADAHAVYDALFAGRPPRGSEADTAQGPPPTEVGCWSHCRRGFWEAAVCKHVEGLEGLKRIDAIFAADRALADLPPVRRKARRDVLVRPLVDAFFAWVDAELIHARGRGVVSSALGYARNQAGALRRFLDDGRLRLENNAAERALRPIAAARKSWLFFGSDDHASAAANLFSLVASCKLHGLDPEDYLRDVIRVMPNWPRERYLELTPLKWAATRARLDPTELAREYGMLTVPAPSTAEDETASG